MAKELEIVCLSCEMKKEDEPEKHKEIEDREKLPSKKDQSFAKKCKDFRHKHEPHGQCFVLPQTINIGD